MYSLGEEILEDSSRTVPDVPILGLYQPKGSPNTGRLALYGDSNCLDNAHLQKGWFTHSIFHKNLINGIVDILKKSF